MVERLFLNRIDAKPSAPPIRSQHHLAAYIFAHEAKSAIAVFHDASSRAEIAMNARPVFYCMPVTPFQPAVLVIAGDEDAFFFSLCHGRHLKCALWLPSSV